MKILVRFSSKKLVTLFFRDLRLFFIKNPIAKRCVQQRHCHLDLLISKKGTDERVFALAFVRLKDFF